MLSITGGFEVATIGLSSPLLQCGPCCASMSKSRWRSRVRLTRVGRTWAASGRAIQGVLAPCETVIVSDDGVNGIHTRIQFRPRH